MREKYLTDMAAFTMAAGLSVARPHRPLGRKSPGYKVLSSHQLSKRKWRVRIERYGRVSTGTGTTQAAALAAAFNGK